MTCHDYEAAIVDAARGVASEPGLELAAREHAAQCTACAARLRGEEALSSGLRALAASTAVPDGGALEAHLLERFDAERTATARRVAWSQRWFAAAAAIVMIAGLAAAWRTVRSQPALVDPYTVASQDEAYQFVPWPGAASLPAFESGQLVRTELPTSVLPLLGISQADAPAGGHVIADVLYGQDGLARAVRLVKVQSTQP
jgi:hypothetical protein